MSGLESWRKEEQRSVRRTVCCLVSRNEGRLLAVQSHGKGVSLGASLG